MTDREERRESRRKRRVRNQIISYSVMLVVLAAVIAGCTAGVRAAAGAMKEQKASKEESIQAAIEASRAEESAQAESAVAALLEQESTQAEETASEYTGEDALKEMVADTIAGMTLEQKVAGLFFVQPEQITGVNQVVQAGAGTREALGKYPVGGLIYFKSNIQSEEQLTEMISNTVEFSSFPLFLV